MGESGVKLLSGSDEGQGSGVTRQTVLVNGEGDTRGDRKAGGYWGMGEAGYCNSGDGVRWSTGEEDHMRGVISWSSSKAGATACSLDDSNWSLECKRGVRGDPGGQTTHWWTVCPKSKGGSSLGQ